MLTLVNSLSGGVKDHNNATAFILYDNNNKNVYILGVMPCGLHRANLIPLRNSARTEIRLLFEWRRNCTEWCTPSPNRLGDPISRSSNRWLCLWLQASVIAEAWDINGSSPWEFSNTFNHSSHSHTFRKRWQYKHAEKTLCLLGVTFCNVCFHPQRYKGEQWASCGQIDWGTHSFFDSPLKLNDPLWTARSTRWLFPRGKDSQGHLGDIKSLSLFRHNDNLQITLGGVFIGT